MENCKIIPFSNEMNHTQHAYTHIWIENAFIAFITP